MENLTTSELDSPSKTPLFIAIAAVIVALVALWLAWTGMSRADSLAKELAAAQEQLANTAAWKAPTEENAAAIQKLSSGMNGLSKNINNALKAVNADVNELRSGIQQVSRNASTAIKKVEDLEAKGIQVAMTPVSAPSARTSSAPDAPDAAPGKQGVYTIKSGDTLGKIAAAYKISLAAIQAANPDVDARRLRIGQQIIIPAPKR